MHFQPLAHRADLRQQLGADFLGDHFPGNPHPLTVVHQMRRGEKPGPPAAGARHPVDHRADAALAVGAGDVRDAHPVFGKCEALFEQHARSLQAQFDPELLGAEQPIDCFLVFHFRKESSLAGRNQPRRIFEPLKRMMIR